MHSVMVCWKARFKAGRKEESERDRQTERERERDFLQKYYESRSLFIS